MSEINNTQAIICKFEPLLQHLSLPELKILNQMVVDRIRIIYKAGTLVSMANLHIGDRVMWDRNNGTVKTGIIFRINQKTVSIKTGDKEHWNVSLGLLSKEN